MQCGAAAARDGKGAAGRQMVHLTNYCMQRKSSNLGRYEEGNTLSLDQFQRYLDEFSGYVTNNAGLIPHYAERRHYGEAASTAFVESTVNQVVAKRSAKTQQRQWTRRGVHCLMHLRTRVLDGTRASDVQRWRKEHRASSGATALAA